MFVGCKSDDGGDPEPSAEQKALEALQGTWKVTDAKKDNVDLDGYSNMTMTISSNKTISTANAPSGSVFPIGSFTFVEGSDFEKIKVKDVDIQLVYDATTLEARFKLDEEGNNAARVAGLEGDYIFKFGK